MAASSCMLVRANAAAPLAVKNGELVSAGQAVGRSCFRDGDEVAPMPGIVRHIQCDPGTHAYLVHIEVRRCYSDAA